MEIKVDQIPVLKTIAQSGATRSTIANSISENPDLIIKDLLKSKLIYLDDKAYTLSKDGKYYLKEYDNLGNPEVYNEGDFYLAVLKFLSLIDKPIHAKYFPESIKSNAKSGTMGLTSEVNLIYYLEFNNDTLKPYIKIKDNCYIINGTRRRSNPY